MLYRQRADDRQHHRESNTATTPQPHPSTDAAHQQTRPELEVHQAPPHRNAERSVCASVARARTLSCTRHAAALARDRARTRYRGRRHRRVLYVHRVHAEISGEYRGLGKQTATFVSAGALLLYMPLQPLFGLASDLVGGRPVLICFGVCHTLFSVPRFNALSHTHSAVVAFALPFAGLVMLSGFTSVHMLAKTELFPARIRALAVGLPYALTTAILGGTTEFVAQRMKADGHESWFYWYVTIWAAVSPLVYIGMPETRFPAKREV